MALKLTDVERALGVPRRIVLRDAVQHYLRAQRAGSSAPMRRIGRKHGVRSFAGLWRKLERGQVAEGACRDDPAQLEYLETKAAAIRRLLHSANA